MTGKFVREERYIVFKVSDLGSCLTAQEIDELAYLARVVNANRERRGQSPLEGVFVEKDWPEYEPTWKAIEARVTGAQPAPIIPESVMEVIAGLVYEVERNICPHEETHRGGQWEICDMCGARWADDMGGKPEFKWPEVVEKARDMLAAAPEVKP